MSFNLLALQAIPGLQPRFVEHLGSEVANLRMESPSVLQEQPHIPRNRLGSGKYVFERGDLCTVRVTSFSRLIQLLGVAQQDDASCGLRNGQNVG